MNRVNAELGTGNAERVNGWGGRGFILKKYDYFGRNWPDWVGFGSGRSDGGRLNAERGTRNTERRIAKGQGPMSADLLEWFPSRFHFSLLPSLLLVGL